MRFPQLCLATVVFCLLALGIGAQTASAVALPGSDPVLEEWPHWPYGVACGGAPFDPASVFSGPAEAENGPQPSAEALRQVVADPAFAWLGFSAKGWRLASESQTEAVFISGQLGAGLERVSLEQGNGSWKLAGSGSCTLRSAVPGLYVVDWALTAEQPALTKNTRRLRITISGGPCNSGMPYRPRKPVFRQLGKRLLMMISIDPVGPGFHTCQGVAQPPFTVNLPGRLGARKLFDGAAFPPPSAAETRGPGFYPSRSARLRQ